MTIDCSGKECVVFLQKRRKASGAALPHPLGQESEKGEETTAAGTDGGAAAPRWICESKETHNQLFRPSSLVLGKEEEQATTTIPVASYLRRKERRIVLSCWLCRKESLVTVVAVVLQEESALGQPTLRESVRSSAGRGKRQATTATAATDRHARRRTTSDVVNVAAATHIWKQQQ